MSAISRRRRSDTASHDDALATYIMRPGRDTPREVRSVGPVRLATAADHDAVLAITREAYQGYRGRFHLDAHIPADRADGFYEEWARQCLAGVMADLVMVSEDSTGRVIGYLAHRRRQPASSIGMPIYGGGLGACRRDAPGAASLIRESAVGAWRGRGRVPDAERQFPVIRVYESVGFHYVRAEYPARRLGVTGEAVRISMLSLRTDNVPVIVGG
jgi:hypothetical protein